MNKALLEQELNLGIKLWNECPSEADAVLENLVTLIKEYLDMNPYDTEMWLKLALTEYTIPIADDAATINSLKKIISLEPNNIPVLLLLAYVQDHYFGIDKDVLQRLAATLTKDPQEAALLLYAQSWYYERYDTGRCEKLLQQSINEYSGFVLPHRELGKIYKETGNVSQACQHFELALKNIQHLYDVSEPINILDINNFIDGHIKGIILTKPNLEVIQELIADCSHIIPTTQASH